MKWTTITFGIASAIACVSALPAPPQGAGGVLRPIDINIPRPWPRPSQPNAHAKRQLEEIDINVPGNWPRPRSTPMEKRQLINPLGAPGFDEAAFERAYEAAVEGGASGAFNAFEDCFCGGVPVVAPRPQRGINISIRRGRGAVTGQN
ncbi:Protein of unknown function [Pyronema omphalodes CBS 100304]|uniref:Uncharacterized protein n=1 Tax=Pyronema omphalodes (strain CBS 100304) TaxID=1076935 RepID=U4L1S5_PYROM|nr:Protein of unknown function [Pyronema omphalodes CBS 100304]